MTTGAEGVEEGGVRIMAENRGGARRGAWRAALADGLARLRGRAPERAGRREVLMMAKLSLGTAIAALPGAFEAEAAVKAGVSAAVRGTVDVTPAETKAPRKIGSGEDVFMGDGIATASQSALQLLLMDKTTFTVGPSSNVVIDKYVYDPERGAGEITASLLRGGFRLVTGLVGKANPESVSVKLPVASVGIRGTLVSFLTGPDGIYILLEGPGPGNSGLEREGGVLIETIGGDSVMLFRPGFVVKISPDGQSIEGPFRADEDLLRRFGQGLGNDLVRQIDLRDGSGKVRVGDPVLVSELRTGGDLDLYEEQEGDDESFEELLPREEFEIIEERQTGYLAP